MSSSCPPPPVQHAPCPALYEFLRMASQISPSPWQDQLLGALGVKHKGLKIEYLHEFTDLIGLPQVLAPHNEDSLPSLVQPGPARPARHLADIKALQPAVFLVGAQEVVPAQPL